MSVNFYPIVVAPCQNLTCKLSRKKHVLVSFSLKKYSVNFLEWAQKAGMAVCRTTILTHAVYPPEGLDVSAIVAKIKGQYQGAETPSECITRRDCFTMSGKLSKASENIPKPIRIVVGGCASSPEGSNDTASLVLKFSTEEECSSFIQTTKGSSFFNDTILEQREKFVEIRLGPQEIINGKRRNNLMSRVSCLLGSQAFQEALKNGLPSE